MMPRIKQDDRAQSCAPTVNGVSMYQVKRPPKKHLLGTVVTVNVGPEERRETNNTHRELLSFYSPFFRSMMNGSWEEAKTNVINLPADDPQVYEIFQNWLYGVDLDLEAAQARDPSLMISLWIFGDKVQVPGFQNAAIEGLRIALIEPPRALRRSDISTAFENSSEWSPLRKLIVDLYVWEGSLHGLMGRFLDENYPKAFIMQFFEKYTETFQRPSVSKIKQNRPYAYNAIPYYVHYPGSPAGGDGKAPVAE